MVPKFSRATVTMPVVGEKSSISKAVRKIARILTPEEACKSVSLTTPNGRTLNVLAPTSVQKNGDVAYVSARGEVWHVKHG